MVQNWLAKQNKKVSTKAFLSFYKLRCSVNFKQRGLLTDLKQQEITELLAVSYNFSAEVLPSQNLN